MNCVFHKISFVPCTFHKVHAGIAPAQVCVMVILLQILIEENSLIV
jgi:hypothetical protein